MASTNPLGSFRSTCCACRSIRRPLQVRAFACTSRRQIHGALPTFTETSSKELNDIHASFRNFVFLPSHLLKRQKNTIYKAKYKSMLESEPVYAEVGEEKIKLQHINQLTDKPNVRTSIARMLDLMGEFNEWNNLPAFLVGLHKAKSPLRGPTLERIARRANGAGRQDVVMNCIRMFGKTDFVLKDQAVVREVMLGAHMRAQQGSWEELPTRKALAQAEKVVELLENPAHSGGYKVEKHDPRAQPDIIGVVLELAAVRASSHLGGKDEDGKVLTYAERLWATWGNADLISETWYDANQKLSMWAPTWNGLKMAAKVLEPESSALGNINHSLRDLEQFLLLAKDMVVSNAPKKKSKQRGLEFYDAVSSQ